MTGSPRLRPQMLTTCVNSVEVLAGMPFEFRTREFCERAGIRPLTESRALRAAGRLAATVAASRAHQDEDASGHPRVPRTR